MIDVNFALYCWSVNSYVAFETYVEVVKSTA